MHGLVHIANVVDQHAEDEGALVGLVGELVGDLTDIVGLRGGNLALHELGEVGDCADNVVIRLREVEVVNRRAWLVEIGQVDEVPVALEAVSFGLNVVGKSSALGERVIVLFDQVRIVLFENGELCNGSGKDVRVAIIEDPLGLSCNDQVRSPPEGLSLRDQCSDGEN